MRAGGAVMNHNKPTLCSVSTRQPRSGRNCGLCHPAPAENFHVSLGQPIICPGGRREERFREHDDKDHLRENDSWSFNIDNKMSMFDNNIT